MCTCTRLTYCLGNLTYIFERLASCCALTAVVSCIMTTLLVMLAMGVGLGYNYCFVDIQSGRNREDEYPVSFRPVHQHVTTNEKEDTITTYTTTTTETPLATTQTPLEVNSTIKRSLRQAINYNSLIEKIRRKRMNVTLELIV